MEVKFTWVNTYNEITKWLLSKECEQEYLIVTLKKVGIEGFKDINKDGEEFELNEIDPFSFFAYLNKYKTNKKRLEILQKLHLELGLSCEKPLDVAGIPTSHPLKVRLFPFQFLRANNEIKNLWKLFKQVVNKKIDNSLFQKVLSIRSVGKGKLSISFFYAIPEYYVPLDSKTVSYIRKYKIKYTFNTIDEYLSISENAKKNFKQLPYEISFQAWEHKDHVDDVSIDEESQKIGSVRTLIDILDKLNEDSYDEEVAIFYRGHSNSKFELKPSIYRTKNLITNEDILFKDIIARSPYEFKECDSTFERLVKMQHYSLPTRLLDITSNPLVALFFACKDDSQENEDGRLFRFEVKERDIKYFDSDAVSVVANISRRPISFSIEHIKDSKRDEFNDDDVIRYLLHEIRSEKSHFSAVIDKRHIEMVFCVKPKLDNPRIIRQEGAFFIFGIDNAKNKAAHFSYEYDSYIISKSDKKKIIKQLDALGINESTLFPEIEHVAKHLKGKY